MYTQTNALWLRLNSYAAVSFLILLVCGALTLGLPLREGSERAAQQMFTIMAISRAQSVEAWMRHAQGVAWHAALRPGLRALLVKKDAVTDQHDADQLLAASMGTTGDTVALSLVSASGALVAHAGIAIPADLAAEALKSGGEVYVSPPMPVGTRECVLISVPVTDHVAAETHFMPYAARRAAVLGRILLLRDLSYLQRLLFSGGAAGLSASCVLSMEDGHLFGNGRKEGRLFAEAMRRARKGENGLLLDEDTAHAFAGVGWRGWGLVTTIPLRMLHASANEGFWSLIWGTLAVYLLCMGGFYVLSRPLAGRILLHTQELEHEVDERRTTQEKLEKAHELLQAAYARRRELAGEILNMQEQMRHSLATELHDNAGQQLTTLLLSLDYAQKKAQAGEMDVNELCAVLERAAATVQSLQKDIRRMSHGLYPPALDLAGLSHSIRQLCRDFESAGLRIHFSGTELPPASEESALALYRIAQEALTNIVRHAQAGEVHIALQRREQSVVLTIEDDGRGFDATAAGEKAGHLGLRLMQERARHCSGAVTFESAPGQGTLVLVEIPLQGATDA
ncbi:MAG: ATP-binding protein [Desulfovibrionaceae bacterium]|nr:histidine kinase [Desulfovibrionaceae bacterium]